MNGVVLIVLMGQIPQKNKTTNDCSPPLAATALVPSVTSIGGEATTPCGAAS